MVFMAKHIKTQHVCYIIIIINNKLVIALRPSIMTVSCNDRL